MASHGHTSDAQQEGDVVHVQNAKKIKVEINDTSCYKNSNENADNGTAFETLSSKYVDDSDSYTAQVRSYA